MAAGVFVDTSAIYSFVDAMDERHEPVLDTWTRLRDGGAFLLTTNYVLVESLALLQRRSGMAAATDFVLNVVPLLEVEWVDRETHEAAVQSVVAAGKRDLSLVDCVSFAVMRRLGLRQVLTVDEHFGEQGFECLPEPR